MKGKRKGKLAVAGLPSVRKAAKPTKRRSAAPMSPSPVLGSTASKYLAALLHPFSKQAEGATVPEPYAVSTTTRKAHVPFVLTSTATGSLDFAVQPHVLTSLVQFSGTATGGNSFTVTNAPAGVTVRGVVTTAGLGSVYNNYRIVAMGVRIKTNVDFTKSGGRLYGAILPSTYEQPIVMDTGSTLAEVATAFDIPFDAAAAAISTSIINLPRGFQFSVSELMSEGGCEITFPITAAAATSFLEGNPQKEQRMAFSNAGVATTAFGGLGFMASTGWSQLVVRGEGLQLSADVLTCEVIYHLEGTENISTAAAATSGLQPAMPMRPPPSGPHEVHACHAHLSGVPVVRYVAEKLEEEARAFGGRVVAAAKSRAINSAERVLGLAVRNMGRLGI